MNIAVCIKQVPDTADLRIDPETNTLIREGVAAVMNPLDEFALEAALQLRDAAGASAVTAFTMGPLQAQDVLRKAVATGADNAVLVSDRAFAGSDTWATSLTLARAIEATGTFDLILTGKQAVDGDTAQVGPGIATHLGWPQVTYVTRVEYREPGMLRVTRMLEHAKAELDVRLPAVLTVLKEANEPRLPSLAGRLRSMRIKPQVLNAAAIGVSAGELGLDGSPTRVVKIAVPNVSRAHRRIDGSVEEIARQLAAELRESAGNLK